MKEDFWTKFRSRKAALRYGHPSRSLRIILVTGNYGKTTTALLIREILAEAGQKVAVFTDGGSYVNAAPYISAYDENPESMQKALSTAKKQKCEIIVVEYTTKLARHAIFYNLSVETVVATTGQDLNKFLLDISPKFLVAPCDYKPDVSRVAAHHMVSFGVDELAEIRLASTKLYRRGTELNLVFDHHNTHEIATYLVGRANAMNVAAAIATAYVLGIDTTVFPDGVARLEKVAGNYDYVGTETPYDVVVDRAAQPESVGLVVDSARELAKRRLIVACDKVTSHDAAIEIIREHADRIIAVGSGEEVAGVERVADEMEAVKVATRAARQGDTILLLGPGYGAVVDGKVKAGILIEAAK